ncbi:hypothetical protein [Hymenobacter sp. BT491]|uniref:hypothetical protein n=1 Tax=Hymenobacter sp. BT491 TaxID=2766779 RepID=UPI001653A9BA|nr:hypothetical protein [Hymenobacter sp. BT491]MBC6991313.1 hypothetical protein [Hymenobacter sp. BT491]
MNSLTPRFSLFATGLLVGSATFLLTACDSTPRERQEVVRNEARKLDTLADRAGDKLKTAGRRAARYDSAARVRARQPLDAAASATLTQELLGTYSNIDGLTAETIDPAYTQFMRQVRERRRQWTQRDWDYATAVYRRLNARLRDVRLDVRARNEVHIRALQTEFLGLENGRDVKDLREAMKDK